MKHVITDLGESFDYFVQGEKRRVCRYGVWVLVGNVADHVIESGDDLDGLKEKYPEAEVVQLRKEA